MVKFASRMDNLKASEIREILKLTQQPEIISYHYTILMKKIHYFLIVQHFQKEIN